MIKVACNQPHINGQSIVFQGFPALGIQPNNPQGPLRGFNIEVSSEMATIPVRLLAPPGISYRSGKASVRDASWNILDVKFHKGGDMKNWAVLLVTEGREPEFRGADDPDLAHFLQTFAKKCRDSGMNVPPGLPKIIETPKLPSPHSDQRPNRGTAMGIIMDALKKQINPQQKPSFILVLLSGIDKFIYPNMKRVGDVMLGMHTVHMLLTKARGDPKKQDQYFSNVALKVNIKLNGINHLLDDASMGWLKTKKTMLVGIGEFHLLLIFHKFSDVSIQDVTHPSPRSRQGTPSVAAVVASVDDNFVQFPASLGLQRNAKKDKNAEEVRGTSLNS